MARKKTEETPVKPKRPTLPRSIRASARIDTLGSREANKQNDGSNLSRGWQQEAWNFYNAIGEAHYAAGFAGACLSRCSLTLRIRDSGGHLGPVFDENGNLIKSDDGGPLPGSEQAQEALELIQNLKSDVGGQGQLLRVMGINLVVAGEFHLVGSPRDVTAAVQALTDLSELQWEVLSTFEFRPAGNDYERRSTPNATPDEIKSETVHVVRIWRQHPQFSALPDSSFRAVLEILEELQILTAEIRGEARSRLASSKILGIPSEIDGPGDSNDDGDGEEADPFVKDFIETAAIAITDKGSAAGVIPIVIRAPADLLEKIVLFDLSPTNSSDSVEKRKEAIQRFAQGMDLPVEIVTGSKDTTFSNAVQIDDSLFKSHIEPLLEIICDALTAGYLLPALGNRDSSLVVHFDSSELVARPNRSQDAKDVYDRKELSGASLRTSTGFGDADAPDEEEVARRIWIEQQTKAQAPQESTDDENIPKGQNPDPKPGGEITSGPLDGNNTDKVLSAAAYAVTDVVANRAVRRVGARLRSLAINSPERATLDLVADYDVAVTLGTSLVEKFSKGASLFTEADFVDLHNWALRNIGDSKYAAELKETCKAVAQERLFRPREQSEYKLPAIELEPVGG